MINRCAVCGFGAKVEEHHIIKKSVGGSDDEENLVYLCPNHHWIADFGNDERVAEILARIKKITGKIGKMISKEEQESLDAKIRALEEDQLCLIQPEIFKPFSEEEWEEHRSTYNYQEKYKALRSRGKIYLNPSILHKEAEILILIRKLKDELEDLRHA